MAKPPVILLLGTIALVLLCKHQVFAGLRNHIEPVVSNVYYLQDYCNLPEQSLEEKYRHRRSTRDDSAESDNDHDHDHDHDHIDGFGIAEDIHDTVKYYAKKGYRKIKEQIRREQEFQRKWKQVFLDPVSQPSIVVRLWRPHDQYYQEHHRILEQAALEQTVRCNILLRMSANSSDSALGALTNSTLGAVVNFLKLNKKPWLNNYRLRIVTSDPNMTQYWLQGRRLASTGTASSNSASSTTTTSSSSSSSTSSATSSTNSKQLPVAIDLLTNPKMYPEPLQKDELEQINNDQSKWLLIELETLNEAGSSSDSTSNAPTNSNSESNSGSSSQTHDDTELVINLYAQSTKTVAISNGVDVNDSEGRGNNGTVSITYQCPIGTFDCAGDGSQCIPSGLRCNGEDNCGNRFDELFNCGTVNLYYIFGADSQSREYLSSDGFWFAVRILILLFLVCLLMYTLSLLCRCCCDRKGRPMSYFINNRSPMVYLRSAKSGPPGSEPLLASSSSSSSGYGPTAGRAMKNGANYQFMQGVPPPPPSYFGNQSDNQKSHVNEYIYVNNNYGQPQGSTTVNTSVRPSRDNINGGASAPPQYPDDFPPMYPNIEYPNYGGTNKCPR